MKKFTMTLVAIGASGLAIAQTPAPKVLSVATDVTAEQISKFIDGLPRDRVSDRPIRTVRVTGDYRVGVYGVFRPKAVPGGLTCAR